MDLDVISSQLLHAGQFYLAKKKEEAVNTLYYNTTHHLYNI